MGLPLVRVMPSVNLRLKVIALGQQGLVFGCQVVDQGFKASPEGSGVNAGAGDSLLVNEVVENLGNLQTANLDALCHFENPHSANNLRALRIRTWNLERQHVTR